MKAALITGASSGIGLELAHIMAHQKHNLVLVARSIDKLNALADELHQKHGITVKAYRADLSNTQDAQQLYEQTKADGIEVSYLINNAGFGDFNRFLDAEWTKLNKMMQLNIVSLTYLTHLYGQDMKRSKFGKIMNVASVAAFQPGPLMAVYFATKAFVLSFSEAIANEFQDYGITVTALCPGFTSTDFVAQANMENSKMMDKVIAAKPEEVAQYGYEAMMKGKTVAIHGAMNKILVESVRFFPRNLVTKLTRLVQE